MRGLNAKTHGHKDGDGSQNGATWWPHSRFRSIQRFGFRLCLTRWLSPSIAWISMRCVNRSGNGPVIRSSPVNAFGHWANGGFVVSITSRLRRLDSRRLITRASRASPDVVTIDDAVGGGTRHTSYAHLYTPQIAKGEPRTRGVFEGVSNRFPGSAGLADVGDRSTTAGRCQRPAWTVMEIAEAYRCRAKSVQNVRERFTGRGFCESLDGRRPEQPPRGICRMANRKRKSSPPDSASAGGLRQLDAPLACPQSC